MALYGWTWVQDDEPTTGVLPTQEWVQPTSGVKQVRDSSNSTWISAGNVYDNLGGAVQVSGDTMTGSLLGAPNLADLNEGADFQGDLRKGGYEVALMTALAALEKRLYDRVDYLVREQFLSQTKLSGTRANIAAYNKSENVPYSTLQSGYVIVLPVFESDGITATQDQLLFYGWAIEGGYYGSSAYSFVHETVPPSTLGGTDGSRILTIDAHDLMGYGDFWINTWALAVR